jgi:tRNA splicing endonuclease
VTNNVRFSPSKHSSLQWTSSGISYPIANFVNYDKFSLQHRSFLAHIIAGSEPASYTEVVRDKRWREAMRKEIQAVEDNGT